MFSYLLCNALFNWSPLNHPPPPRAGRGNNRVMPRFHSKISRKMKQIRFLRNKTNSGTLWRQCIDREVVVSVLNFQLSSASPKRLCLGSQINNVISRGNGELNCEAFPQVVSVNGESWGMIGSPSWKIRWNQWVVIVSCFLFGSDGRE